MKQTTQYNYTACVNMVFIHSPGTFCIVHVNIVSVVFNVYLHFPHEPGTRSIGCSQQHILSYFPACMKEEKRNQIMITCLHAHTPTQQSSQHAYSQSSPPTFSALLEQMVTTHYEAESAFSKR